MALDKREGKKKKMSSKKKCKTELDMKRELVALNKKKGSFFFF